MTTAEAALGDHSSGGGFRAPHWLIPVILSGVVGVAGVIAIDDVTGDNLLPQIDLVPGFGTLDNTPQVVDGQTPGYKGETIGGLHITSIDGVTPEESEDIGERVKPLLPPTDRVQDFGLVVRDRRELEEVLRILTLIENGTTKYSDIVANADTNAAAATLKKALDAQIAGGRIILTDRETSIIFRFFHGQPNAVRIMDTRQ